MAASCHDAQTVATSPRSLSRFALRTASDGLIWPRVGYASIACPQRRSVVFLPLPQAAFLARQQSRRPAILRCRYGRERCGAIAPRLVIAIEAAMGAARATDKETTMATIGTFTKSSDGSGFVGTIKTVVLNVKAKIAPADKDNDKAPDYRIYASTTELGAAWKKTSNAGREYLSVKLDDPSFPAPIFASLVAVEGKDEFALIWSRRNTD